MVPEVDGSWTDAWAAALDELELTLEETERLLAGNAGHVDVPTPWTPPALAGPLPGDLRTRALALAARQGELVRRTSEAVNDTRRQLALLDRLGDLRGAARRERPVYLDVRA